MASEESGAEVTESVQRAPAPPLRGLIASYHGYRQEGLPPAVHRGLPSPYLTLIITLDDPLTVAKHPDPLAPPGQYTALAGAEVLMGLHDTDYGSRDFAVRDPEGNLWSFGTYRGEPRKV